MWHYLKGARLMFEKIFLAAIALYVLLWIADVATAKAEARKKMMVEVLETVVAATAVGTLVWWML